MFERRDVKGSIEQKIAGSLKMNGGDSAITVQCNRRNSNRSQVRFTQLKDYFSSQLEVAEVDTGRK